MTALEKGVNPGQERRKQGHEIIERFWWMDRWGMERDFWIAFVLGW